MIRTSRPTQHATSRWPSVTVRQRSLPSVPNGKERPPARAGEDRRLRRIDRLDSDAVPERDPAFDALSELTGIWVVPGRVAVHVCTPYNVVEDRHPLPATRPVAIPRPDR